MRGAPIRGRGKSEVSEAGLRRAVVDAGGPSRRETGSDAVASATR